MTGSEGTSSESGPTQARLHLHRGWGAAYTGIALALFCIAVGALVDNLESGKPIVAVVSLLAGTAIGAYLARVGLALLVPSLTADADGVRGRIGLLGSGVKSSWADITIDSEPDTPGRLQLDFSTGTEKQTITLYSRSWFGFGDFVWVVATHPQATRALTPAGEQEMLRLLGVQPPPGESVG